MAGSARMGWGVGGGGGVGAHEQLSWMFNSQGTEAVSKAHGLDSGKPERRWGGLRRSPVPFGKRSGHSWAVPEINGQRQGPHAPLGEDFQDP